MGDPEAQVAPAETVTEVLSLYERHGHDRYDEVVSQLDHALQTAALARRDGAGDALVAAALLHDVGHLLALDAGVRGRGVDLRHEAVGARYLSLLFGPEVTTPIALHVQAKRYRCARDPSYHDTLSAGSVASLARQGGPLTADEASAFEQLPGSANAVALREWDDSGKVLDLSVPPLSDYVELLEALAR